MIGKKSLPSVFLGASVLLATLGASASGHKDSKGKVLLFLSTDCPIAARYSPRIANLYKTYSQNDFAFKAYFPNALETRDGIEKYKTERQFSFPCDLDLGAVEAKKLGVTSVPTVVVLDSSNHEVYRGPIDDNDDASLVKKSFAKDVLDKMCDGKPVKAEYRTGLGCVIMPSAAPPAESEINYAEHIAPIVYAKCAECHRPGEVAPFSLLDYENAKKWAPMIERVTQSRQMPPWKAVAGYGEFKDEHRLSETEIETLRRWAEAGAPKGDLSKAPSPPKFNVGWALGDPDMVVGMPQPYHLAADGGDVYRNFVIKTNFKETRYITAMDVKPGNKKIVHHVIAFLDRSGQAERKEAATKDGQPGYTTFGGPGFIPVGSLGGWAPGNRANFTPKDTAFEIKPGTDIVLQVHYHKDGKAEEDQTKVGIYFAKEPPKQAIQIAWVANPFFRLPAGEKDQKVEIDYPIPANVTIYAAMPHMHLLGQSMKAEIRYPDGTTKPLVYVDNWDFNWQLTYAFKEPIQIPKGSKIHVEGHYDNSANNPRNPSNPPKDVGWGEQTTDEMFLLVVPYTVDGRTIAH